MPWVCQFPLLKTIITLSDSDVAVIMLPMSFAPHWIATAAHVNPLWYLVQGARNQFSVLGLVAAAPWSWAVAIVMSAAAFGWASHEFNKRR